jgi:hypothetical protein
MGTAYRRVCRLAGSWYVLFTLSASCTLTNDIGCIQLADISERIVIAFTDVGSEDSNRLTVLLNRAYRVKYLAPAHF